MKDILLGTGSITFAAKILKKVVLHGLHPQGISFRATFGEHCVKFK